MNKLKVTDLVKKSLVKILVIDKKTELVRKEGSGVIINDLGFILTAHHVVSLLENPNYAAVVFPYGGGGAVNYSLIFGGFTFSHGEGNYLKPAKVDLAILTPQSEKSVQPIKIADDIPREGIDVIMAGFPCDVKTPLDMADNIDESKFVDKNQLSKFKQFSRSYLLWIMVKHGMVGGVQHIYASNVVTDILDKPFPMHAAEYWIDNTYAPGASGGPVVNMQGQLIGIITERGLTFESDFSETITFPVPSGTVRVLSHKLITWSLEEIEKTWKKHHGLENYEFIAKKKTK